jgi:myo-inositol-1(or 4)-monophosphatase
VIDPLDGTTNYLYGRGDYCVSIAAETPDHTLAGVVYDPTRDEVFSAARGQGATLNGRAIRPSAPSALGTALIGTGFSYEPWIRSEQAALVAQLMPHIRDIRRGGSAALDLCAVSCGRLDGYFETVGPWDKAAGMLILEEAGGQTAHLPLTPGVPDAVVAAGAAVFDALLALLVASRSTRLPHD